MAQSYHAVVLSDLHVRAGLNGDDFVFDSQFRDFVHAAISDGVDEIILNGDIIDFVAALPGDGHPDPTLGFTEVETLKRLQAMAKAHPAVFGSLAAFVDAGGRIIFIPGNHDWDVHWPSVRTMLRKLLAAPTDDQLAFVLNNQAYCPRDGIHVEHGHQLVGDQNTFWHYNAPIRQDPLGGAPRLEQNFGNFLVRTLVTPLEDNFPFINNVRPISKIQWFDLSTTAVDLASTLVNSAQRWLRRARRRVLPWEAFDLLRQTAAFRGLLPVSKDGGLVARDAHPDMIPNDLYGVLGDDSRFALRAAARRLLRLGKAKQVVLGHSHEIIDKDHEFNRRTVNGYLNPGAWNPCRDISHLPEDIPLNNLRGRHEYEYSLGFVRIHGARGKAAQARVEVFEEGTVVF